MSTYAEQLPSEIWLMIFQYFEVHHLFHAFHDLNSYFNEILSSNYLFFNLRLRKIDHKNFFNQNRSYSIETILHRVKYLRCPLEYRSIDLLQFLQLYSRKMIQLRTLFIHISSQDQSYKSSICQIFNGFSHLEYLSLNFILDKSSLQSILTIPTLRICHLILQDSVFVIDDQIDKINNNIKQLFITFLKNVDNQIINLLLKSMPKLRCVKIFGSYFSFLDQSIFNNLTFLLPDLRFLKLKLSNAHFISNCFKELHSIMPCLKHFDFYYEKHILPELFLNFFTSSWWPILEQISYIHIDIKGHLFINIDNDDVAQISLENNRKILYERANRLNGIMKVKWTQTDYSKLRRIEILINKFI